MLLWGRNLILFLDSVKGGVPVRRGFGHLTNLSRTTHFYHPHRCASAAVVLTPAPGTMTTVHPAGVIRNWDFRQYEVKDLEAECDKEITRVEKLADEIVASRDLSIETVLKPMLECYRIIGNDYASFPALVGTAALVAECEDLRSAGGRLKTRGSEALVNLVMRPDLFDKLVEFEEHVKITGIELTAEHHKFLGRLILNGKRNGLQGPLDVQEKVKTLKKSMAELQVAFCKNYIEEKTLLQFDSDELRGLSDEFIGNLKKPKLPGLHSYYEKMHVVPQTRRRLDIAYNSRCLPENNEILKKLVLTRQEHAAALGYSSHASYIQEVLMAKNPSTVQAFFAKLVPKLQEQYEQEKKEMLKIKEKECTDLRLEFDGKLNKWDVAHYFHLMSEKKFELDSDLLKEYFPLEVVLSGMLSIYQNLLGLEFTKIQNPEVWHDSVTVHQVDDLETGETLGYFYLDLFPRPGKFGHACCEILEEGVIDEAGARRKTALVLVCNFPDPFPGNPSLLSHDDVTTFFHEFGHAMHAICSKAETQMFHGCHVERDFVEAPSQMLENWCYEKESLSLMSKHFKTGEALPDKMIKNLIKSKAKDGGYLTLRQIYFSLVDQRLHDTEHAEDFELVDISKKFMKDLMDLEPSPGTNDLASFWHMGAEYDAQYYGYMWSLVYGEDMFESVFKTQGVLNPDAGKHYRRCVLEVGGSLDGTEILKNFLGREASMTPFLRSKGLL